VLLLAFFTASRRSNLSTLVWGDLRRVPGDGIEVLLRRTKTDQLGAGTTLWLPETAVPDTCPVRCVVDYADQLAATLGATPLGNAEFADQPVVARLNGRGGVALSGGRLQAVSGETIAEVVKRAVKLIGEDPAMFSGHSTRAGFATTAADAGMAPETISEVTGHKSIEMVLRYVRRRPTTAANLAKQLGL
jgi:hypothetical protein